jgi:hypothetical protein
MLITILSLSLLDKNVSINFTLRPRSIGFLIEGAADSGKFPRRPRPSLLRITTPFHIGYMLTAERPT